MTLTINFWFFIQFNDLTKNINIQNAFEKK